MRCPFFAFLACLASSAALPAATAPAPKPGEFTPSITSPRTVSFTGGTGGWGGTSTYFPNGGFSLTDASPDATGIVRVYVSPATQPATLVAALEVTRGTVKLTNCRNCTDSAGDEFPKTSDPKFTVTIVDGAFAVIQPWMRQGGGSLIPQAGKGLTETDNGHYRILSLTGGPYPALFATPENSRADCAAQTFWFDENYLYLCVASGNIKRVPLTLENFSR